MNFKAKRVLWLGLLAVAPAILEGGEWSGYFSVESRAYESSPQFLGQDGGVGFSAAFEPEYYHEWKDGDRAFEFVPYFRWDSIDEERRLIDLRELSYLHVSGDWEFLFGVSKVFWGVTESQHLVDTINQTDLVANPDGEDKLGQQMAQIVYVSPVGDFSLFVMPGFRERTFPGKEGRLRSDPWVATDDSLYEASNGDEHIDLALRWFNVVGDFDIGFHYFRGTNRDPLLLPGRSGEETALIPYYEQMDQVGLDVQFTKEGWLLKLEAIGRDTRSDRYGAMVGGFEYTFYGLAGSSMDAGLIAEAHLDTRGSRAPTPFNKDAFVGTRLTWNDEADSSAVLGAIYDWENGSVLGRFEFERRIGSSRKIEVTAQKMSNIDVFDSLRAFEEDSYVQVALSRYF